MSNIIVRVLKPEAKRASYMGAGAAALAFQVGGTAAVSEAKRKLFKTVLPISTDLTQSDYYDRLRTPGSQYDNNLILRSSDGKTEVEFIDVRMIISHTNSIVETQLLNKSGTVKEYIQKKDYKIEVHGNLVGADEKFPYDTLEDLIKILNETTSFYAASVLLSAFDIHKVVMKDAKFDQKEMKYFNVLPFTINLASDEDYNFLIQE